MPRLEHQKTEHIDVAVIGDFAKDKLVYRGNVEISSGGTVYYGAIALQRIGVRTIVVTRLAERDFQLLNELKREGITVYAQAAPQTSGIENIYTTEDMDHRVCHVTGFAGPFRFSEMPTISAHTFLVGPLMAGIVDIPMLRNLSTLGNVALDSQGFVRVRKGNDLVFTDWSEKETGLAFVKILKVDDVEAEVLTGEKDRVKALKRLATYGPSEIVLTCANGVTVYADGEFYEAPFIPRKIVGRTGRGDTCLAVYLGTRLTAPPKEACRLAAAATSLKMEKTGPLSATLQEVKRLADLYSVFKS
jgi:sugar/nucleoside kinase (ribokinase family)